jgi:hypothetical protein
VDARRAWTAVVGTMVAVALLAGSAYAQLRFREGSFAPRYAPDQMPDGSFVICRLAYRQVRSEPMGIGWMTDYPYAEVNLSTRLSELTRTRISRDQEGSPNFFVVRPLDRALYNCPILVASDVGTIGFNEEEAARLQAYLLKGGFLWVDDFWGTAAWTQWSREIAKVLPSAEYPIRDVPADDPILRTMFDVGKVPQITNIQFWRGVNGQSTSERGADSQDVHFRAIRDAQGRIMVLMSHNTDVADAWEREGEDPGFFYQFAPDGYALGINVVLHALTH